MSRIHKYVKDYLSLRQSLGYKLERQSMWLPLFADYLQQQKSDFITTKLAFWWATQSSSPAAITAPANRLSMVRRLALHLKPLDPRTEIPPRDLLTHQRRPRYQPYIYSDSDVLALLQACQSLQAPLKFATYQMLIGLLATTGMRLGEALALDVVDIDFDEKLLLVRSAKFGKTREVALHATTLKALKDYTRLREHLRIKSKILFISQAGTRLFSQNVWQTFDRLRRMTNLPEKPNSPRIHDLRHSFAVQTLIRWYREGHNVEAKLPLLSTYLGHVSPSSTYHYLSATPELLSLAGKRLQHSLGELP